MPDNKPQTAEISATVNGGEYSPTGLRFDMNVNSFPSVSASIAVADDEEQVKAPVSSEVMGRIAELQAARLEGRTEPDFEVSAEDGLGGSMDYSGFISAPILEITKVSTVDKISSVGEAALLDALDLSIYKAGYELARAESGNDLKPIPSAENGDVPAVIQAVTDVLVGNYDLVLADEYMPVAKQLLELQHGVNEAPLEIWKSMLGASDVTYESWSKAFETAPHIARVLSERVKDMLEAPTPGFWNKVRSLMASFQMYYVPEFDGPGYFVRSDKKVDDEGSETIKASVTGLTVADGSPRILQPGGVVMMMRAVPTERRESQADPNIPRVVAYAPDPLTEGFIQRESPPFWLLREEGVPIFGSEVEEAAGSGDGKVDLSLEARKARKEKGIEYKEKVDTVSEGVMTELCEVMFKEIQLAHSTAGLTLPLDFSLNDKVGKRATIEIVGKDGEDGGSFQALVSGITHSVDLRQGKSLNSYTQVRLSHAKY